MQEAHKLQHEVDSMPFEFSTEHLHQPIQHTRDVVVVRLAQEVQNSFRS